MACFPTEGMLYSPVSNAPFQLYFCVHNYIGSALEREGHDRSDINLPGSQLQLL